jgi:hypothetical protein
MTMNEQRADPWQNHVAIGEALFASTLATVVLTGQIASGRLSHHDAEVMLDGATLVLERHRGLAADPQTAAAVDYARARLSALMTLLRELQIAEQQRTHSPHL